MKRLTILGVVAFVGFIFFPATVISGPPGGLDVQIVNSTPVPVTVSNDVTGTISGDVEVTNDPSDPVPVTGSVDATISGEVEVTNARQAVFYRETVSIAEEISAGWGAIDVPDGKRLVIEHISVIAKNTTATEKIYASIGTKLDDSISFSQPIGELTPTIPDLSFGMSNQQYLVQPVKIYADSTIRLMTDRSDTANNVSVFWSINGYLIDL